MINRTMIATAVLFLSIASLCSAAGEERMRDTNAALPAELRQHVTELAVNIGERGVYKPDAYRKAADYIIGQLITLGYDKPRLQTYSVGGVDCNNIEVEIKGAKSPDKVLVVGAHYDTVPGTGGANDNSSGIAALLSLAHMLKDSKPDCTIRFLAFANEEPPYFQSKNMGSMVYARRCKDRGDQIIGMLSLETIGYYSDEKDSQKYPDPYSKLYPPIGNFLGFVANVESRELLERAMASFRKTTDLPCEGAAVPDMAPGIGWSDHWSFWQHGYPALMVTDTAPFRYQHYHRASDTPDKLDFERMSKAVAGLEKAILELARS